MKSSDLQKPGNGICVEANINAMKLGFQGLRQSLLKVKIIDTKMSKNFAYLC